jgi:hypothetical protein
VSSVGCFHAACENPCGATTRAGFSLLKKSKISRPLFSAFFRFEKKLLFLRRSFVERCSLNDFREKKKFDLSMDSPKNEYLPVFSIARRTLQFASTSTETKSHQRACGFGAF